MKLYHVTRTKSVKSIRRRGLLTGQPANWVRAGNLEAYGDGEVYCCTHRDDAVRWAVRFDWENNKATGTGKVSVVEFDSDAREWAIDDADPLSQMMNEGQWLHRREPVPASSITDAWPVTAEMIRELVRAQRARDERRTNQ